MSDELIISGGGSYSIATDEMLSSAANLERAAEMTRDIAGSVQLVDERLTDQQMESWGIPTGVSFAEGDLDNAYIALLAVAQRAEQLGGLTRFAASSYGLGEAFAEGVSRAISAQAAALLGLLFPKHAAALLLAATAVPILTGIAAAAVITGRNPADLLASEQFSAGLNKLISDPAFLLAVRYGVMNLDEFTAGAAGVPPSVVTALSAAGLIGLSSSAGLVQRLGGIAGVLRETPVALVGKTTPAPVVSAQSLEQRVNRIPHPTADEPAQIRIEKYSTPGELDRFSVYVSGTVNFDIGDSSEPFDGTSNLSLAAQKESAAFAAVAAAMKDAGITSETPVDLNGYSQGAAIVARLVESGEYNTVGLLTVGGNIGQIHLPENVPTIILEHTDDVVPAAGGLQGNNHALVVERQAFGGRTLPEGIDAPAHQIGEYRETARLVDQAGSPSIRNATENLARFGRNAETGTVTNYQFERVRP